MKRFTDLYFTLDETTKTTGKVEALKRYFAEAPPDDAAWALCFLIGDKIKRTLPTVKLREWAALAGRHPGLAFRRMHARPWAIWPRRSHCCFRRPTGCRAPWGCGTTVEERLLPLRDDDETSLRDSIFRTWREMDDRQRLVWNKMITGEFRVGISRQTIIRALGELAGLEATVISHRLMGSWEPTGEFFRWLLSPDRGEADVSRPYPLQLAFPLDALPETLGDRRQWCAEWKWDGIRAQIVKRGGMAFIWSRGGELLAPGHSPSLRTQRQPCRTAR